MGNLTALLLGAAAAAGAVLPPGMLNLSVATKSLDAGKKPAFYFAAGIVSILLGQAGIAVAATRFLRDNPEIIEGLGRWAVPVLLVLSGFFFYKWYRIHKAGPSKKAKEKKAEERHPFVAGITTAIMNFLAIPYFFAFSTWLISDGIMSSSVASKSLFVLGAGAGAMLILVAYAYLAEWVDENANKLTHNMNLVVASVFVVLAAVQSYRVFL